VAKIYHDDTIAAIATPLGEGAIAVIRVSGPDAITAADKIFVGKSKLADAKGFTVHFGRLVDTGGSEIDEVLVTIFRNPNSYTGEDSVEVSCHGGMFVTQKILETILSTGVRQAEPGEFTKRAFLNGKIDLSQAEAVADIITAKSEASHRTSLNQLEGRFSDEIKKLRTELMNLGSLLELELDFSEEGIDLLSKTEVMNRIGKLKLQMKLMIDSYQVGKFYREGASVVIVGKPNVGKSSLFNALLKENRAIVTEIPGTTRDSLEESIAIGGVLFRLNDTAGLRETVDPVEVEGVSRAKGLVNQADVLLLVVDATEGVKRVEALSFVNDLDIPKSAVIAYNKIDICQRNGFSGAQFKMKETTVNEVLISAKTGEGLDELRKTLLGYVASGGLVGGGIHVTNSRHQAALLNASDSLSTAEKAVESGTSREFIALDIKSASDSLAEIVGEITTDDMLNNIFQHFCIGK